jgi:hypothetical protein
MLPHIRISGKMPISQKRDFLLHLPPSGARMAQPVEAEIGAGIWVIRLEALLTIGNCVATDIGRRGDIGRTITGE